MKSSILIIGGLLILAVGGIFFIRSMVQKGVPTTPTGANNPVQVVDGKQIIEIKAKGGYFPMEITAEAGIPTILRVSTSGTFDCSSAIRIPSMDISKNLPSTGQTDIDLGTPEAGKLAGTCGMGMYPFEIDFQS